MNLCITNLRSGYTNPAGLAAWRRTLVIAGLSFNVEPGQIVQITGPNGSGKTTLFSAVLDPQRRWAGNVCIGSDPLTPEQVAYLPQSPALTLSPWNTVAAEATAPLRYRGFPKSVAIRRLRELMADLNIEVPLGRRVDRLSGGQRVKVALLRAFIMPEVRLVILDEPTEALDRPTRQLIVDVIRSRAEAGLPILVATHGDDLAELPIIKLQLIGNPATAVCAASNVQSIAPSGEMHLATDRPAGTRTVDFINTVVGLVLGVTIWTILAWLIGHAGLLPSPLSVARDALHVFGNAEAWHALTATLARSFVSWVVGVAIAVPFGVLLGYQRRLFGMISPWLSIGRATPLFMLVGAAAGLFPGQPEVQRMTLIALTLTILGLHVVSAAAAAAPRRRVDLARLLGARPWRRVLTLGREATTGILTFVEFSLPTALVATIFVETLLIPRYGLGPVLANRLLDPDSSLLFAYLILPGVAGAIGTWIVRQLARHFSYEL